MLYDTKWDKKVDTRVRDCLVEARNHVERGWCKCFFEIGDRVCALGAIARAASHGPIFAKARDALAVAIGGQPDIKVGPWNDLPSRTKEEVLAAFDRAIAQS